jgi:hypothetical protein
MFATYAYARVKRGRGAVKFFLTRSLKISSLYSLTSLKGCQTVEIAGKKIREVAEIILPVLRSILPILPDQTGRMADLVARRAETTKYRKGAF